MDARFVTQVHAPLRHVRALHDRPHAPQCAVLIASSTSQPSDGLPLQSAKPARHTTPQTPETHVAADAPGPTAHATPQQFVGVVDTHASLPASTGGATATQRPSAQTACSQTAPHDPQLVGSFHRSTHRFPQSENPVTHRHDPDDVRAACSGHPVSTGGADVSAGASVAASSGPSTGAEASSGASAVCGPTSGAPRASPVEASGMPVMVLSGAHATRAVRATRATRAIRVRMAPSYGALRRNVDADRVSRP